MYNCFDMINVGSFVGKKTLGCSNCQGFLLPNKANSYLIKLPTFTCVRSPMKPPPI